MSIEVPDTWAWSRHREQPTARVCIADGWECESVDLTADECRSHAQGLLAAADKLDALAHPAGLDRATNYSDERHREPFLPILWRMTYQPHTVTMLERMTEGLMDNMRHDLARQSWLAAMAAEPA